MNIRKIETRYGQMFVMDSDQVISKSLIEYGEWSHGEIALLERFIKPGMKVLDIGANVGSHTLAFSKAVGPNGWVIAFEPQPAIFGLLTVNLAANGANRVLTVNAAAGKTPGWIDLPNLNYATPNNFGALRMEPFMAGNEKEFSHIPVPVHRLDDLKAAASAHVIKIDVEGMEAAVLEGAHGLISKSRPVLLVEDELPGEGSEAMLRVLFDLNYDAYWQAAPIFDPNNFNHNKNNLFANIGCLNVLAVPREGAIKINGQKITSVHEHLRKTA